MVQISHFFSTFLQYKKYKQDIADVKRRVLILVNAVDAVSLVENWFYQFLSMRRQTIQARSSQPQASVIALPSPLRLDSKPWTVTL